MPSNNEEQVILEWKYSPLDFFEDPYFEDPYTIEDDHYIIEIKNGEIKAIVFPTLYDSKPNARIEFHEKIKDLFWGAQVLNFKKFNLSKPTMYRLHPNGRKDITIFADPGVCIATASGKVDRVIKDKDGNIIEDTKAKRINAKRRFAQLSAKFRKTDKIAASILESYNTAVNDPADEFIHLYEILESLCGEFGNEKSVRDALGVSCHRIKKLRILANIEPVFQGRHRGKNTGQLREALNIEKNEAREIASELIQNYLDYLDKIWKSANSINADK